MYIVYSTTEEFLSFVESFLFYLTMERASSFIILVSKKTPILKGVSGKTSFKTTQGTIWLALDLETAAIYSKSVVGKTVWKLAPTKELQVFSLTADSWKFLFDSFYSLWFSQYSGEGELQEALFIKDGKLFRISDGNTGHDRALESFLTFCQERLKKEQDVEVQAFLFDSKHASVHPDSRHHTEVFVPEQLGLFKFIEDVKVGKAPDAPQKRKLQRPSPKSDKKRLGSPTHFGTILSFGEESDNEEETGENRVVKALF